MKNLIIGFEAEAIIPVSFIPAEINFTHSYYWRRKRQSLVFNKLAGMLHSDLGFKPRVLSEYHQTGKHPDHWYLEPDHSIEANHPKQSTVEIISPPLPEQESLRSLRRLFNWMKKNNFSTNFTTGLHVSISFDKEYSINFFKLLFCLKADAFSLKFGRADNFYAKSVTQLFKEWLTVELETNPRLVAQLKRLHRANDIDGFDSLMNQKLWHLMKKDKWLQFSVKRFKDKGYTEFRLIGGKNYHKGPAVYSAIKHFCQAYQMAESNTAGKALYYNKLRRFLDSLVEQF